MAVRVFCILVLVLFLEIPAVAGFEEGKVAYERGDYATALTEWRHLSEKGDIEAQYRVGRMYGDGAGVPQDSAEAVKWYRRAAKQGHIKAQHTLSLMYAVGHGVRKNPTEADMWRRKAIKKERSTVHPGADIDFISDEEVYKGTAQKTDAITISLPSDIDKGQVVPVFADSTLPDVSSLQLLSNRHKIPIATFFFGPNAAPYVSIRFRIGAPGTVYALARSTKGEFYSTAKINKVLLHGQSNLPKCRSDRVVFKVGRVKNLVNVKMLIQHCMNLDRYIHKLRVSKDGEIIADALLSVGVSRNPFFAFKFKGLKAGKYKLEWEDTSGVRKTRTFKKS